MFRGVSAFPLTPLKTARLMSRPLRICSLLWLRQADSLGILGSTGSYAYLTVEERARDTLCGGTCR